MKYKACDHNASIDYIDQLHEISESVGEKFDHDLNDEEQ